MSRTPVYAGLCGVGRPGSKLMMGVAAVCCRGAARSIVEDGEAAAVLLSLGALLLFGGRSVTGAGKGVVRMEGCRQVALLRRCVSRREKRCLHF